MYKQYYQFSYFFRDLYQFSRQKSIKKFQAKRSIPFHSHWPTFQNLDLEFIHTHFDYSMNLQINSPFRWTPLIQIQDLSSEFLKKMRLKRFDENNKKELIDCFLFEAIKNSDFDYYYDYECSASQKLNLHGKIDFLIYHKHQQLPLIPVVRVKQRRNIALDMMDDYWNKAEVIGIGQWVLKNSLVRDPNLKHVNIIHTNGNKWKMIRLSTNGDYQETGYYYNQEDNYEKIYRNFETQRIVLGLIKFALDDFSQKEKNLHKLYNFIDERMYLTEMDPQTKAQLDKNYRFWWFLPKKVRNFFFKY